MNAPTVRDRCPFYHTVPKGLADNAAWRRKQRDRAASDVSYQKLLLSMCSKDILFWINGFVFTEDPRTPIDGTPRPSSEIPFVTWEFQDETILAICEAIEQGFDLHIVKARDMGASWMPLMVMSWYAIFHRGKRFKCLSRKEELVDSTEDEDALFPKIDFVLEHLPFWMRPKVSRTSLHFFFPDSRGAIDGESTNADAARGGRRSAMLLDEFASVDNQKEILSATKDVTRCRIFVSTPKGASNPFAKRCLSGKHKVIRLGWFLHPHKRPGLYSSERGVLHVIDKTYKFPVDFKFILDGKLRSPWYDRDEAERDNGQETAQEVDMDFLGSAPQFFSSQMLDRVKIRCACRPRSYLPLKSFFFPPQSEEWEAFWDRVRGASLHLWCPLDYQKKAPRNRRYRIGVDVAAGSGASNSCVHIADATTGEQVGEFTSPYVLDVELAHIVKAICGIFQGDEEQGPLVIWEDRGPGKSFGTKLWELKHRHVYFRQNEDSLSNKQTDTPGWNPTPANKRQLLGRLRDALKDGVYAIRSEALVDEARYYVHLPNDTVAHTEEIDGGDPTGARSNHGDRVIAAGLAWHASRNHCRIEDLEYGADDSWAPEPPVGSPAYNRRRYERQTRDREEVLAGW